MNNPYQPIDPTAKQPLPIWKKALIAALLLISILISLAPTILEPYYETRGAEVAGDRANYFIKNYANQDFQEASSQLCPGAYQIMAYNEPDGAKGALLKSWTRENIPMSGSWKSDEWEHSRKLVSKDAKNINGEALGDITVRFDFAGNGLFFWQKADVKYWCISGYEDKSLDFLSIE